MICGCDSVVDLGGVFQLPAKRALADAVAGVSAKPILAAPWRDSGNHGIVFEESYAFSFGSQIKRKRAASNGALSFGEEAELFGGAWVGAFAQALGI